MSGIPLSDIPLACPLDGLALKLVDRAFVCERRHAYDVSRHGHVNLLPVQFKPSKSPGDSAPMVAARRRVLESGLFDPFAEAVADIVADALTAAGRLVARAGALVDHAPLLVDAGCGEGFYTRCMAARLASNEGTRSVRVLGADIAVPAIVAAAKRHRVLAWCVANNTRLPLLHGRADLITSLFGFEAWGPWSALQTAGQQVIIADAGPWHLRELREVIYPSVRVHDAPSDERAIAAGYERIEERRVTFTNPGVPDTRLVDVLAMTPHAHRAGERGKQRLAGIASIDLTVDVVLRAYRRCP